MCTSACEYSVGRPALELHRVLLSESYSQAWLALRCWRFHTRSSVLAGTPILAVVQFRVSFDVPCFTPWLFAPLISLRPLSRVSQLIYAQDMSCVKLVTWITRDSTRACPDKTKTVGRVPGSHRAGSQVTRSFKRVRLVQHTLDSAHKAAKGSSAKHQYETRGIQGILGGQPANKRGSVSKSRAHAPAHYPAVPQTRVSSHDLKR